MPDDKPPLKTTEQVAGQGGEELIHTIAACGGLKLLQEPHIVLVEETVVDDLAWHHDFKLATVVHRAAGKAGVSILPLKVRTQ